MIEGVVFDLDGTLVTIPIEYEALYREIRRELKTPRVKPLIKTVKMLDNNLRERIYKIWERAELEALPYVSANNEGMKLYKKYSTKPVALVTMQGKRIVREVLKCFRLPFNTMVTREDSIDRLQQIKKAVTEMKLEFQNVLVIGDRDTDEKAAEQLGCKFLKVKE